MKLSHWPLLTLMLLAAAGCTAVSAPLGLDGLFGGGDESQTDMLRKMADAPAGSNDKKPAAEPSPKADPALAEMLAGIDQMSHLPADKRDQLKQDIAAARPQDRAYLAAVIRKLALPPGEEGTVRKVSPESPASHVPPPKQAVSREEPAPPPAEPRRIEIPPRIEAVPPLELTGGLPGPAEPPAREAYGAAPIPPYATYPATATPNGPPLPQAAYPPPNPAFPPSNPPAPAVPAIAAKAWRAHLRDAIAQLERDLKAPPPLANQPQGDVMTVSANMPIDRGEREVLLRLLKLAAGEREDAVRRAGSLPAGEQEFWTHQMHTLATLLDPDGAPVPSRRAALALKALRDAEAELAAGSSLEVRNLTFCSEVQAFGNYQKFAAADFAPGQEVLLYAEIDNFRSQETKGGYKTSLQGSYHVLDSSGRSVAEHSFPVDEDHCTSRRRDFFIPFRLYLPKLSPGEYTLQLSVEDTQAKKFGQGSIAFRIKGRR